MNSETEEIAIVGMSGAFPGAKDIPGLWSMLLEKRDGMSTMTRDQLLESGESANVVDDPSYVPRGGFLEDAESFDSDFFGISPAEAAITDPQHRVFLSHCWLALEDAGYDHRRIDRSVGVFAGEGAPEHWFLQAGTPASESPNGFRAMLGNANDFLATKVSYSLNLRGPSLCVQSACSTGLAAVGIACQSLSAFGCDMALAGGVSIRALRRRGYLYYEGMIYSKSGRCRPFDRDADGTAFGEGVGVVCLKRLSDALDDGDYVYAVIKSVAMNNDGSEKAGFTAPGIAGQAEVIELAQELAGVRPEDIGFVETHGTATALGDAIEVEALTQAFGCVAATPRRCRIGSIKANVGHLDAAAGIASLIKAALVVNSGLIPPLINYENPNPLLELDKGPFEINTETVEWPPEAEGRIAGVSSFGIGGTNVHAIVASPPRSVGGDAPRGSAPLLLSAKDHASLASMKRNLASYLEENHNAELGDIIAKANRPAHDFPYRWGTPVGSREMLIEDLKAEMPGRSEASASECVFAFPGQGAQFGGMARAYYGRLPVFSRWVDEGIAIAERLGIEGFRGFLLEDYAESEISETYITQPLLFVVEYALAMELIAKGVKPTAVAGHSVGEYAAAAVAGVMGFEDCLKLVERRGFWMRRAPRGAMIAVSSPPEALAPLLADKVSISLYNTNEQTVLSGEVEAIEDQERKLASAGLKYTRLLTSHAYHSPLMDGILGGFEEEVRNAAFAGPKLPFLSSVDGAWLSGMQDWPEYWTRQIRQPVRFDLCIRALRARSEALLLEVGPGKTLSNFMRASGGFSREPVSLLPSAGSRAGHFESSLIRCWESGIPVAWADAGASPRSLVLAPGYSFAGKRYGTTIGDRGRTRADERLEGVAAPVAEALRPEATAAKVASAQAIRLIWERVLGDAPPSDDASFFLSGGDSFAGIVMVDALRRDLGMDMGVKELMLNPSVSALASLARASGGAPPEKGDPFLFRIQGKGSKPGLFLVAGAHENRYFDPASGNSYEEDFFRYFGNMIANLGEDHPLYAFKPKGLAMGEHLHTSVELMAAHYVDAMMGVQPKGPYWIGGECVGGVVACEMARRLEAEGHEVGALILLDTPRPGPWVAFREGFLDYARVGWKALKSGLRALRAEGPGTMIRRIGRRLPVAACLILPIGEKRRAMNRALNGSHRYQRTLLKYRPKGGFTGRVALLMNREWNREKFMQGWKRELGPMVSLFEIPGDHETRLTKNGGMVGEIIRKIIDGRL